jgi:hypothetical protein
LLQLCTKHADFTYHSLAQGQRRNGAHECKTPAIQPAICGSKISSHIYIFHEILPRQLTAVMQEAHKFNIPKPHAMPSARNGCIWTTNIYPSHNQFTTNFRSYCMILIFLHHTIPPQTHSPLFYPILSPQSFQPSTKIIAIGSRSCETCESYLQVTFRF